MDYKKKITLVFMIVMMGLCHVFTIREGQIWDCDFYLYFHHAKNIVEGADYNQTHYIYNPLKALQPKAYPPVFPLFLAPVYKWFGLNLLAIKVEITLFILLSLVTIIFIFKNEISFLGLTSVTLMMGLNHFTFALKEHAGADFTFLFFIFLSLYVLQKGYEQQESGKNIFAASFISGLSLYLAFGTKHLALSLIVAFVAYDLLKNRKITRFCLFSLIVFWSFVFLQSQVITLKGFENQINIFKVNPSLILTNLRFYLGQPSVFLDNGLFAPLRQTLYLLFGVFSLLGFVKKIRQNISLLEVFFICYPIPLLFWPFPAGVRFILPMMPLYFYYGFFYLFDTVNRKNRFIPAIIVLLLFVTYALKFSTMSLKPWNQVDHPDAVALFDFVRKHTHTDDVIVFNRATHMGALTERNTSYLHETKSDEELFQFLNSIAAKYLVRENFKSTEELGKPNKKLTRVYQNSLFTVYQISGLGSS